VSMACDGRRIYSSSRMEPISDPDSITCKNCGKPLQFQMTCECVGGGEWGNALLWGQAVVVALAIGGCLFWAKFGKGNDTKNTKSQVENVADKPTNAVDGIKPINELPDVER
jgi:hypothetical protein